MKAIIQDQHDSPDVLEHQDVDKLVHVRATLEPRHLVARGCSITAAVLFSTLASFQVELAVGLPWVEAAWGGGRAELGMGLRVASGVQTGLAVGFALIVLRRAGHSVWAPLPLQWLPTATRVLTGYMALGTLMNAASRSPIERALWTPIALSLAVLCGIVAAWSPQLQARSPESHDRRDGRLNPEPSLYGMRTSAGRAHEGFATLSFTGQISYG